MPGHFSVEEIFDERKFSLRKVEPLSVRKRYIDKGGSSEVKKS